MLLDECLNDLQKFTKEKITYEKVATVLKLKGKQAVGMRIRRKQPLKDWEIEALNNEFKNRSNSQHSNISFTSNYRPTADIIQIPYWSGLPEELKHPEYTCVMAQRISIEQGWELKPENLCIVPMVGDKMVNYWYKINDGDILIIDTSKNHISGNGVYFATSQNNTRFWIREMQVLVNNDVEFKGFAPSGNTVRVVSREDLEKVGFRIVGKVIKNVSFRL